MRSKVAIATASLASILVLASACSGSSSGSKASTGGASGASSSGGSGGTALDGGITWATGKDNSGTLPYIEAQWNKLHPSDKVTIHQQSSEADTQHSDLQQNFQAKSSAYDVVTVDVVWSAEFAAKQWLVPLKGDNALDTSKLLPATVNAATYAGTLYAAPYAFDNE